jgi:hypothetical protein
MSKNQKSASGSRSLAVDVMLGVAAVLISAISVLVAISANQTQERLLAASTWPNLDFGTSNLNEASEEEISFELTNSGVGPARIRWYELSYKGQVHESFDAMFASCCKRPAEIPAQTVNTITSSVVPVLKVGDSIKLLRLKKSGNPDWLWQKVNVERRYVSLKVCYCSVLDTCWMFDSASKLLDPPVVATCPSSS